MGLGWNFEPLIARHGGIAARRELLAGGWTETDIWLGDIWGCLDRIRRGWYAAEDLPDDARAAWRAGGPLACVSALLHHGLLPPAPGDAALGLHICVASDGHVPRDDPYGPPPPDPLIVHWSTADRRSGSRRAVSPAVALRQARACTPEARARAAEVPLGSRRRLPARR